MNRPERNSKSQSETIYEVCRGSSQPVTSTLAIMNIRDHLNRRIIPTYVTMVCCFALFLGGGIMTSGNPTLRPLLFIGLVGFAGCIIFLCYGIKCPKCHNPLGQLSYIPRGGYFRLSQRLCFCPFCGVSLDAKVNDAGQQHAGGDCV